MIAVIDYKMGNLASVQKALNYLGLDNKITRLPKEIKESSAIILPGVGSFQQGMKNLIELQLTELLFDEVIVKKKLFMGICLGMQLLMDKGSEPEDCLGLGWIKGSVNRINNKKAPIPHLGWNKIYSPNEAKNADTIENNFYFIHSYHVTLDEKINDITIVDYEFPMVASFRKENIFATQFHPEKVRQLDYDY